MLAWVSILLFLAKRTLLHFASLREQNLLISATHDLFFQHKSTGFLLGMLWYSHLFSLFLSTMMQIHNYMVNCVRV
jgi:hypothetical protein